MSANYKCVLFCEDIRQEVGGRVSLMGILGSKLMVQGFPLVFPKLCLFVEWGEITEGFEMMVNILTPDGNSMTANQPKAAIPAQAGVVSRSMIVLTNLAFPKAGQYVFEFIVNGKVINREIFEVEMFESSPIPNSKIN